MPTLEELPPGVPGKITIVDLMPMPELPVKMSQAVVLGVVKKVQTYLSEDKRNIYTEYTISVEELLKDESGLSLYPGATIALDGMGGAVRLPSGRVLSDVVKGYHRPLVPGSRYVLFLYYHAPGTWFRPLKSVELRDGVVAPEEIPPVNVTGTLVKQGMGRYDGTSEAEFVGVVRDAIRQAASQ